jgi:hypothetical protein
VTFRFALAPWFEEHADQVRADLEAYYSDSAVFTGRYFDRHAATTHPDRFEAGDVLAAQSLSVLHDPHPAGELLIDDPERFDALLADVPNGPALWEVDRSVVDDGGPADVLWHELQTIRLISWVGAGKLMAAKRPRLIPVYDAKVRDLLDPPDGRFWVTLRDELVDDAGREAIAAVCTTAPDHVGLLRRIDVALWMHARRGGAAAQVQP